MMRIEFFLAQKCPNRERSGVQEVQSGDCARLQKKIINSALVA